MQLTLRDLENNLMQFGKIGADFGLPSPRFITVNNNSIDDIIFNEHVLNQFIPLLIEWQKNAFNTILDSVYGRRNQRCFSIWIWWFRKDVIYNALKAAILSRGNRVKAVAPTGLVATLLKIGQ